MVPQGIYQTLTLIFDRMYDAFLDSNRLIYKKKYGLPPNLKDPAGKLNDLAAMPIELRVKKLMDYKPVVATEFKAFKLTEKFPEEWAEVENWNPREEFATELQASEEKSDLSEDDVDKSIQSTPQQRGRGRGKRDASSSFPKNDSNSRTVDDSSKQSGKKAKNAAKASTPVPLTKRNPVNISTNIIFIVSLKFFFV